MKNLVLSWVICNQWKLRILYFISFIIFSNNATYFYLISEHLLMFREHGQLWDVKWPIPSYRFFNMQLTEFPKLNSTFLQKRLRGNFCSISTFDMFERYFKIFIWIFNKNIIRLNYFNHNLVISVHKYINYILVLWLKSNSFFNFKSLVDIIVVDRPGNRHRFILNYRFLNVFRNITISLKVYLKEKFSIYSIVSLFSSSMWVEREIYDMFGIKFTYNFDLRRILTDYGFSGFPLRKDFPLVGFKEVLFEPTLNKIMYTEVILQQEYRYFSFKSPWTSKS